jgi:hypothetical protein
MTTDYKYKDSPQSAEGPASFDGLDKEGFSGGDKRFNKWPTTLKSAIQAVLDHVPAKQRGEYYDILRDVFMEMEQDEEE